MRGVPTPDEIRACAIRLCESRGEVRDVARRLGVPKSNVSRWFAEWRKKQKRDRGAPVKPEETDRLFDLGRNVDGSESESKRFPGGRRSSASTSSSFSVTISIDGSPTRC
jgi:transposase-like protein